MSTPNIKKLRALVVEDQELFRDAVADELEFYGFQSTKAVDGEDGLKNATEMEFDLIVSDMRMPNKDGQWLLRELRKRQKSFPPFIFMTGYSDLSRQDAFNMGADGFLGKPLNTERLATLLEKLSKTPQTRWSKPPVEKASEAISRAFQSSESSTHIMFGRGGMFIGVDAAELKTGERLAFDLRFEAGPIRHLSGVGTVAWRRENHEDISAGYGVEFDYISAETLPEWLGFLQRSELVAVIPNSL